VEKGNNCSNLFKVSLRIPNIHILERNQQSKKKAKRALAPDIILNSLAVKTVIKPNRPSTECIFLSFKMELVVIIALTHIWRELYSLQDSLGAFYRVTGP
jgi:hypothetical protein